LLDFACHILGSAFHLITVHGLLLKCILCSGPKYWDRLSA
jgi:hypothetical protein